MNKKQQKRQDEMFKLRSEGRTLQEIGDRFGVTRERVRQILSLTYSRRRDLRINYGITLEQYEEMNEAQEGRCKICKQVPETMRLAVDRDHKTGEVRGLLCHRCNLGIGSLRDSIVLLEEAIKYLTQ